MHIHIRFARRALVGLAVLGALVAPMAPAQAAFPGQPNMIVFWSTRNGGSELFTMGANGNQEQLVGSGFSGAWTGQLSPDGTRIAFVSDGGPGTGIEVWVTDLDGSNAMELTSFGQTIFDPSWNPAGTKIVFSVWVPAASSLEIFTVRASGGTPHQITDSPAIDEYQPVWSPDGAWIAFSANNDADPIFNYDLYRVRPDGTDRKRITNTPDRYEGSPDWKADGSRVSYTVYVDPSGRTDVITSSPNGADPRNITKNVDLDVSNAIWLPNGRIAFGARPAGGGDSEIWAISPDRTDLLRLTQNDADDDVAEVT
jgi:Tol biopolymer transport system component